MTFSSNHPLQLLVCDNLEVLQNEVTLRLQKVFCNLDDFSSDCFCRQCKNIKQFHHPSVIYINPTKNYTIEDIEIIFERVLLSVAENEFFFFVLFDVQKLNNACANKLLKIFEEPPARYRFILTTNNINQVLPTIVSRSLVFNIHSSQEDSFENDILKFFIKNEYNAIAFEAALKDNSLSELDTENLFDILYSFYSSKLKNVLLSGKNSFELEYLETIIKFLSDSYKYLPRSGSSNFFWKNLYLSFPNGNLKNN